jgi:PAS domain-containing protein
MLRLSIDGKIIWANDQYYILTGCEPVEGGQRFLFLDVFLDEDRESALEAVSKTSLYLAPLVLQSRASRPVLYMAT